MSPSGRDYRAEYLRRLALGRERGISRGAARGHGMARAIYDRSLEDAVRRIREGSPLGRAARSSHVSSERVRQHLLTAGIGERVGRRWLIGKDQRPRVVPIFSRGRRLEVMVPGYEPAKLAGRYVQAVYGPFLAENDPSVLAPFAGKGVYDTSGRYHPFEVRPNELYRLTLAGPEPYEDIYRIVA